MRISKKLIISLIFVIVGLSSVGYGAYCKIKFTSPPANISNVTEETLQSGVVVDGTISWSVGPYFVRRKWIGRNRYDRWYLIKLTDGNYISLKTNDFEDPYIYRLSRITEDEFVGQPQDVTADPVNISGIVRKLPVRYQVKLSEYINDLNSSSAGNRIEGLKCTTFYVDFETARSARNSIIFGLIIAAMGVFICNKI